jgi:hypothetical protein
MGEPWPVSSLLLAWREDICCEFPARDLDELDGQEFYLVMKTSLVPCWGLIFNAQFWGWGSFLLSAATAIFVFICHETFYLHNGVTQERLSCFVHNRPIERVGNVDQTQLQGSRIGLTALYAVLCVQLEGDWGALLEARSIGKWGDLGSSDFPSSALQDGWLDVAESDLQQCCWLAA